MHSQARPRPVVLCVLDGLGERTEAAGNAVLLARTPELDALRARFPHTALRASGPEVGLAEGAPGRSDLGHLTLGAGRAVPAVGGRIDEAERGRRLGANDQIDLALRIAAYDNSRLHLLGLVSDGGVHSSFEALLALIDAADFREIPVVVHAFLDGRDCPPQSAMGYLDRLALHLEGKGIVGTVAGRHYAMDRGGHWDRTYAAFHAIVRDHVLGPEAPRADTPFDAVSQAYAQGLADAQVPPTRIGDYQGIRGDFMCDFAASRPEWIWTGEEIGLAFNIRGDRMRQLTSMLTGQGLAPEIALDLLTDRGKPVLAFPESHYFCLTEPGPGVALPVAFPAEPVRATLGEVLAWAGMKQLRLSETEKACHVTSFFSGGRIEPFAGQEDRILASPVLGETYAEHPEMSAPALAEEASRAAGTGAFDFILVTFANPDAVAHTGDLSATVRAVEAVDAAVGRIARAVHARGGALLVTAAHGNCERMIDVAGSPDPSHTASPVPFICALEASDPTALLQGGQLCDVAPTILALLGLEPPAAMKGRSLLRPRGG
ncbi:MAG: 2,3-bisphosphoglycerate-independent phosphoglycerate mutase [Deltaproteobacteria bacterium]|nr:2,3-bisphosphoglycerate-independent phosphoglycerate mutase [Deltaproteobacteria bacterium]